MNPSQGHYDLGDFLTKPSARSIMLMDQKYFDSIDNIEPSRKAWGMQSAFLFAHRKATSSIPPIVHRLLPIASLPYPLSTIHHPLYPHSEPLPLSTYERTRGL